MQKNLNRKIFKFELKGKTALSQEQIPALVMQLPRVWHHGAYFLLDFVYIFRSYSYILLWIFISHSWICVLAVGQRFIWCVGIRRGVRLHSQRFNQQQEIKMFFWRFMFDSLVSILCCSVSEVTDACLISC